jgi:CDP-glycerol glycerophosphotransferase
VADKRVGLAGRLASRFRSTSDATPEATPEAAPVVTEPQGRRTLPEEPLVSVVVPVYAVERYIDECLRSILGQTYRNLEVVVVDDGSPDGSMDVVDRHAARDDRIRVVHQENAGLGAARNRGIDEASGDLVTFVDSDDTVPQTAIANHVRQLVRTGSDFSVGALERQQSDTSYVQKPWSRRLHEVLRRETTLEDVPEAMANVFACTKVFRADFLAEIGLRFPVGVRYEDQVPITRAYLRARSFDVLPDIVYSWRARRDGSSITQQKARKDDLHDRLLAVEAVRRLVVERDSAAVLRGWYGKVFEFDLFAYIRAAVDADDEYYATLAETVRHVLDSPPPDAWDRVDLRHRIAAWALVHEGRETLTRLLESPLLTGNVPVRTRGDHPEADPDRLGLHGPVPAELLAVSERDLLVEARLDSLAVDDDALVVRGLGFTRYVESSLPHEVTLSFTRRAGGDPVTVATRGEHVEDANVFADRHHEDHRDDGFVARVPLEALVAASDGARTVWHTRVSCTTLGGTRHAVFRDRVGHGSVLRPARRIVGEVLVEATWSDRLGLVVTVRRDWVVLAGRDADTLSLRAAPGVTPAALLLQKDQVGSAEPTGDGTFRVTLDLTDVADPERRLLVDTGAGKPQPLVDLGAADDGFVRAAGPRGRLETHEVGFEGDVVRLGGTLTGSAPRSLRLAGPRAATTGAVTVAADRWQAELPIVRPSLLDSAPLPLPRDIYRVVADDGHTVVGVPDLDPADAPRDVVPEWAPRLLDGGVLAVERSRGAELEAQTRHGQQDLLSSVYAGGLRGERRPLVLVDAFVGRGLFHAAGAVVASVRAERPDLEVVWALRDESLPPPPGVTPVSRGSVTWFEQLAAASHVLTNGTMPRFYEKPVGQRLLQLWSGTPLLRFGYAVPAGEGGRGPEQRALARDAAGWDVLHTGSPDATAWMREATRYDGEVREVGHPALDAYRADDRADRAAAARERLGIGDGPVLLYAPTTRQAVRAHTRRDKVVDLDVEALHKAVPGLTVLHRGHPNTANQAVLGPESGMLDVTLYPELSDLVLLSDAVVSDYSSLVVDVLASDTPLALFVPDKEDFDEVGWFVDLFDTPPGPVATTTEELLPWLTDGLGTPYPGRTVLAERLLPFDDGHAAARVVAAEWA